jgi:hypothetical protein
VKKEKRERKKEKREWRKDSRQKTEDKREKKKKKSRKYIIDFGEMKIYWRKGDEKESCSHFSSFSSFRQVDTGKGAAFPSR